MRVERGDMSALVAQFGQVVDFKAVFLKE